MDYSIEKLRKRVADNQLLILFSVVYYCIIIFLAWYLNITEDDAYSLHTSSGNLGYALNQSLDFESQPPVYFLLLTIWRFFSDSILWARIFSIVLIIFSQVMLFRFIKKNCTNQITNISSVLFLLNPVIIFTFFEIRLFALLIFLSMATSIYFFNTYHSKNITHKRRIVFVLLAISGIFTQYLFAFLLFTLAIVLLVEKKWKAFWLFVMDMAIPLVLVLLFIPHIMNSVDVQNSLVAEVGRPFVYRIVEAFNVMLDRSLIYILALNISQVYIWILRILVFIFFLISIDYLKLRNGFRDILPFLVIVLGIEFFYIVFHLIFGFQATLYKYTIMLFVPLFLLMIFLFKYIKPKLLSYGLAFLIILYISEDFKHYKMLYKDYDIKSLSEYIMKDEKKDEPIFIYRNCNTDVLSQYYKGINLLVPLPKAISYDKKFGPETWEIKKQDIVTLAHQLINYDSFYIVIINEKSLYNFSESKKILTDFLFANFEMIQEKFFGQRLLVYKFSKKHKDVNE